MTDIAEPFQIISKIYDNPIEAEKDFRFKREVFSQRNKGLKIIRCKPEIESNKDYDKGLTQYRMRMRGLYIKDGENKWEYQYPLLANLEEQLPQGMGIA